MFKREFKVVHIFECNNDCVEVYYLKGSRKDVKKEIEGLKKNATKYALFGKTGMVVWL